VRAGDRERLEHLSRYVLRPPVAQEALELTADGQILLNMRRAWHDGTRAILFEPHELFVVRQRRITGLYVYFGR